MEDRPFNQQSFAEDLKEEKLMGAKCRGCGALFVPPRPLCPNCPESKMEWAALSGTGKLKTFTSIAVVPPAMAEEGYGRKNPYVTGVVALEENCNLVARIVGVDSKQPESIRIGMDLKAVFLHQGKEPNRKTILAFQPA